MYENRLTPNQCAKEVGVHLATIWRWMLTGVRGHRLHFIFVGGRRFILRPDLDEFLAHGNSAQPPRKSELAARAAIAVAQLDAQKAR